MKLTTVLIIATMLQVSAATYGQRITLSEKNAPLGKVLKKVTVQSGYSFLYEDENLTDAKNINVTFSNLSFEDALKKLFANQPLTYTIKDKTVVIKPKEESLAKDRLGDINISGRVLDVDGKPLPGATIHVKNGSKSTVTDVNGNFKLNGLDANAVLVVSYVGFLNKEVAITDQKQLTINLEEDRTNLNEVMVIGYGTSKKRDLTGSVGGVNMGDLEQAPIRSFDEALAGRVAGVQVTSSEGQPGAGIDIVIRGASSLTQDNSPLYVIDGFPIENPDNNTINPSEIESLDVLKDASATAIYGARGSNGVIIITTKRGKAGKPVIRYSGSYGIQQNIHNVPLMDSYEYLKLQNEINPTDFKNAYLGPIPGATPSDPPVGYKYTLDDYKNAKGTNWQSELFRRAPMQNHSLSISGGTDKTRYSVSGQLFQQDGTIINSGFKRYQGKMTLDQVVNDKLKVGTDITYTNSLTYGSSTSSANNSSMNNFLYSVWGYRPISPIGIEEDVIDEPTDDFVSPGTDYRFNPILTAENQLRKSYSNNFVGNAYAEYTFIPGLKLRISAGINKTTRRNDAFNNSNTYSGNKSNPFTNGPNGSIIYYETNTWQNENILSYDKQINKDNKINIIGGFSLYGNKYNYYGLSANALPNEAL
ncbi:MAG TPA: SusC/RagA family TonB-linked outer membrane protein, partial [Mucilaginibacter sp.]